MKTKTLLAGIASFSLLAAPAAFAQQGPTAPQQETIEQERGSSPTTSESTYTEPTRPSDMEATASPAQQDLDNERMVQPEEQESDELEAASQKEETIPLASSKPAQQDTLVSSNTIVGVTVKDAQGEELGEIEELMIDPQSGTIKQVVLAISGGWITSAKRIALPWETLKVGLGKEDLVVEIDKNHLQNTPGVQTLQ